MSNRQIIVIDDDIDDLETIESVFEELNLQDIVKYISNADEALEYLTHLKHSPYFILCDVNMPGHTGFEIRKLVNEIDGLESKLTPFLFWSTSDSEILIQRAYGLNIQGYFKKPTEIKDLKKMVNLIADYWNCSSKVTNN